METTPVCVGRSEEPGLQAALAAGGQGRVGAEDALKKRWAWAD